MRVLARFCCLRSRWFLTGRRHVVRNSASSFGPHLFLSHTLNWRGEVSSSCVSRKDTLTSNPRSLFSLSNGEPILPLVSHVSARDFNIPRLNVNSSDRAGKPALQGVYAFDLSSSDLLFLILARVVGLNLWLSGRRQDVFQRFGTGMKTSDAESRMSFCPSCCERYRRKEVIEGLALVSGVSADPLSLEIYCGACGGPMDLRS